MTDQLLDPEERLPDVGTESMNTGSAVAVSARSPGKVLREAREARGLSVEAVADILRFSEKQIHHIENDNYDALPGATLVRGFIRGYAKFLRLDPQQLLAQLDAQVPVETSDVRPPSNIGVAGQGGVKESVSPRVVLIAAGAILLAVIGGFLFTQMDEASIPVAQEPVPIMPPPGDAAETVPAQAAPVQELAAAASANDTAAPVTSTPASDASATALILEFDDLSWIEVRDAGQNVIFVGEYPKGTRQVVEGKSPLALWVGRASVVRASYKGKVIDLKAGSREDIARVTLD